ncbi:MAG: alcohol dehydrogenase catalytic domain-containing protein [Ilumatobacter sp.]
MTNTISGAPGHLKNSQAGRTFTGFVKYHNQLPRMQQLTMREIGGREVVVRVEAAQTCYTSVEAILRDNTANDLPFTPEGQGMVVGHGGVGIVEAIGPQVMGTRVGDRVVVHLHGSCGRCHSCLHARADKCRNFGLIAEGGLGPQCVDEDGLDVFTNFGGMAELLITNEEHVTPVFTDVTSEEMSMLTCVGGCGLGMSLISCPVEFASDVVVFGAGPVGLSAVQGARIKGASRIVVVEPIPYRREVAMQLGATAAVDPNLYTARHRTDQSQGAHMRFWEDELVDHVRSLLPPPTNRLLAGSQGPAPDHVIEAVGGDLIVPKSEPQGPDPTGVTVLNQCWDLCSRTGTLATSSFGHPAGSEVSFPATEWSDGSKHHRPGTGGGTNDRRDTPKFVRLMETGQLDMKTLAARSYPLDDVVAAYQVCGDREVIATVVTPNT